MEVILTKNHKVLGNQGDIIKVKQGYALNFLFPNSIAVVANTNNKRHYSVIVKQRKRKFETEKQEQEAIVAKLTGAPVKVTAKAGKNGKLFGAVTTKQISEAIQAQLQLEIDRRRLRLTEAIKGAGTFKVHVKLFHQVSTDFDLEVEAVIVKEIKQKVEKKKKRKSVALDEEEVPEEEIGDRDDRDEDEGAREPVSEETQTEESEVTEEAPETSKETVQEPKATEETETEAPAESAPEQPAVEETSEEK